MIRRRLRRDKRVTGEFCIVNKAGMHARPSAAFVKTASRFMSEITVEKDGYKVCGKSIMGLITLEAACGTAIRITAVGPDAAEAVAALGKLITAGFPAPEEAAGEPVIAQPSLVAGP